MSSPGGHDGRVIIAFELLFLLLIVAIFRLLLAPLSTKITTVVVVWSLLSFTSYLVGEFETSARTNYGLTTRTQIAFALTYGAYSLLQRIWSGCEYLPVRFWVALWLYLTFIAPLIGILFRRMFPERVVFVTDFNQNQVGLLRWWGFECAQIVPIDGLEEWLKNNSESVGRLRDFKTIVVDISDIKTEQGVSAIAPKYFIDFIGIRSFKMSAYLLGPPPRAIGPFVAEGIGRRLKRIVDLTVAIFALILLGPLMLLVALLIKATSPGPVFYRHRRLGRNMREFDVLKFRTMYNDADKILEEILKNDPKKRAEFEKNFKLKDDPRITPVGRWLRKLSIDELPQLLNVLAGQMSLVGPRPIVEKEIEYYLDYSLLLFRVPPGLTGLWQISGRTDTTYEERVRLDTKYVREWSLFGDLAIILKTIPVVLSRKGAY
ncbi:MAG: sugar transferase [candidate division WOR-3 bacterium]